jgi:hypothetical protein
LAYSIYFYILKQLTKIDIIYSFINCITVYIFEMSAFKSNSGKDNSVREFSSSGGIMKKKKCSQDCCHNKKMWVEIHESQAEFYDGKKSTVTCYKCKLYKKKLMFKYNEYGDFTCPKPNCDNEGDVRYVCIGCKSKKKTVQVDDENDEL